MKLNYIYTAILTLAFSSAFAKIEFEPHLYFRGTTGLTTIDEGTLKAGGHDPNRN